MKEEGISGEGAGASRLEELYLRYAGDARRLAYLLTGNDRLAEDLVQDAFVSAARRLAHLRDPEAFGAYLRRAVVNLANSSFRRTRLERAYLKREARQLGATFEGPDVATRVTLRNALLRLPPRQRSAIVLRFYLDLSERDIAEILRCRVGAVKALVHRGMETLRLQIEE